MAPSGQVLFATARAGVDLQVGGIVEIRCRRAGRLTILDLQGRCAVSAQETEVEPLRALVARLVAEGRVYVAVNLAELTSVDARGLGELVFTQRTLDAAGGGLAIVAPNRSIRRMLAVTRLDQVLRLFDSEIEVDGAIPCKPSARPDDDSGLQPYARPWQPSRVARH